MQIYQIVINKVSNNDKNKKQTQIVKINSLYEWVFY